MAHQTRLDRYFSFPKRAQRYHQTLPDLPWHVRRCVYEYLNLTRDGRVPLNVERQGADSIYRPHVRQKCACDSCRKGISKPSDWSCSSEPLFPILLVCRVLYDDICPILYSSNEFVISAGGPGSLDGVLKLGATSLASITSLAVRLSEVRTFCDSDMLVECAYKCEEDNDMVENVPNQPLTKSDALGSLLVRQWSEACNHLATYVGSGNLRLSVLCDVDCYETGRLLMQPLHQLPRLAACAIRLSAKSDPQLAILADTTTRQLTGRLSLLTRSLLPRLPHEIHVQILEHTDLIAPHDLELYPAAGYLCRSRSLNRMECDDPPRRNTLNSCLACAFIHKPCYQTRKPHGALSSSCDCWRFPIELFLVNREWHGEAIRLFYSQNHFYLLPFGFGFYRSHRMADINPFIEHLPKEAVKHLRSLQIVLPHVSNWLAAGTSGAQEWEHTIDILAQYANLSKLTLTIDNSLARVIEASERDGAGDFDGRAWKRDLRVVKPLAQLRGLKRFFVHLGNPVYGADYATERAEKEALCEKMVMGDDYDAIAMGKYAVWGRWFDPSYCFDGPDAYLERDPTFPPPTTLDRGLLHWRSAQGH